MFDRAGWLALLLLTASLTGCTGLLASDADELRSAAEEAAAGLDTPRAALEAGYEPTTFCSPDEGVHWIDESRLDDELNPSQPEALLFLPTTQRVESTLADEQRFLGVAYMAPVGEEATAEELPSVAGIPLDGPKPGHSATMSRHGELHVYLDEELSGQGEDPFPETLDTIDCPQGTTPPDAADRRPGARAEPASCRETLTGERTHEHARIELYLESEEPYDLSPERYQLADRRVHFEAGERDAGGAIVHLHEAGATLGCVLETLGWQVGADRLVTDTGRTYEATPENPFEVFVDGDLSNEGFDQPIEGGKTYVLRYDSSASPTPCPNVSGGPGVHEHAQLEVRLNGSQLWDFSAERYQNQAPFVALEDGSEDAEGARIHVHQVRPTLGCLFATFGWETAEDRIETDTGSVYEAGEDAAIEVLVDGQPAEEGFDEPIRNAHTYEVRYNETAETNETDA